MQKTKLSLSVMTGLLAAALTGCGGSGGGSDDSYTPPALQSGPGGTLLGFYAETQDANDPNAEVGGIYVDAPKDEGRIKGRASFRYFDCQAYNSNNLVIDGTKLTSYLSGTIEGPLDSASTSPNNSDILLAFDKLSYSRASNRYTGGYVLDQDNNDTRTVPNCTTLTGNGSFVVARKGNITLYPADAAFPSNFQINVNTSTTGNIVSWTGAPSGTRKALIDVINPGAIGDSSANGIVYQTINTGVLPTALVPQDAVTSNTNYMVVVQLFDENNQPLAFKQVTAKF